MRRSARRGQILEMWFRLQVDCRVVLALLLNISIVREEVEGGVDGLGNYVQGSRSSGARKKLFRS
jgi:hypothetical protein